MIKAFIIWLGFIGWAASCVPIGKWLFNIQSIQKFLGFRPEYMETTDFFMIGFFATAFIFLSILVSLHIAFSIEQLEEE